MRKGRTDEARARAIPAWPVALLPGVWLLGVCLGVGALCASSAVSAENAAGPEREYAPRVGEPHPPLELPSIEQGRNVRLSDYRGKKVLLIHFASW